MCDFVFWWRNIARATLARRFFGARDAPRRLRDACATLAKIGPATLRDASATLPRRFRDACATLFGGPRRPATLRDAPRRLRDAFVRLRESSGHVGDLLKMTQTASACSPGLKTVAFRPKICIVYAADVFFFRD